MCLGSGRGGNGGRGGARRPRGTARAGAGSASRADTAVRGDDSGGTAANGGGARPWRLRAARVRAEPARLAAAIPLTTAGAGYSTQHAAAAPAERGTAAVNASAASAERVQPTTGWLGAWDPHRI